MTTAPPAHVARINIALMIGDARDALRQLTAQNQPSALQSGILLGLTAAGYVLEGRTADEAWEAIEPLLAPFRALPGDDNE